MLTYSVQLANPHAPCSMSTCDCCLSVLMLHCRVQCFYLHPPEYDMRIEVRGIELDNTHFKAQQS